MNNVLTLLYGFETKLRLDVVWDQDVLLRPTFASVEK